MQSSSKAMLSPFDILGIKETDDKYVISGAYKRMILMVHPDKAKSNGLNWTKEQCEEAFSNIRKAYKTIIRDYNFIDMPEYNLDYALTSIDTIQPNYYNNSIGSTQQERIKSFNSAFEKHKVKDEQSGYADPYKTGGYSNFGRDTTLTQDQLKKKLNKEYETKVTLPGSSQRTTKGGRVAKQRIIKHQRPHGIGSRNDAHEFGLTNVDDYGFVNNSKSANMLLGSDLSQVHNDSETWETSVRRNKKLYNKFDRTGNIDKDVKDIVSERNKQDSNIDKEYERKKEKEIQKKKELDEYVRKKEIQRKRDNYNSRRYLN